MASTQKSLPCSRQEFTDLGNVEALAAGVFYVGEGD